MKESWQVPQPRPAFKSLTVPPLQRLGDWYFDAHSNEPIRWHRGEPTAVVH